MIGLTLGAAVLLQAAAQAPSKPESDGSFLRDKRGYETCVTSRALMFERAKESVPDTVIAAFAACQNERATLYFTMQKTKETNGQEFDRDWAERFIKTLIEDPLRDETTIQLFEIRAKLR